MSTSENTAIEARSSTALATARPTAFDSAPMLATEDVPECPVCRSDAHAEYAVGFDYELITCKNLWRFVECQRCEHVWLNPRPAASALADIYPPSYYAYSYEDQVHPIALHAKRSLDALKLRGILRSLAAPPRRYLDVGCGSGRFLRAMQARGVARDHIFGIELNRDVVERLNAEGYRAFCEPVERCTEIPDAQLDLITMFHVIEHVSDPAATVRKLASWLSPSGVLALETPNLDSLDARMFKRGFWGGYHIPRHWNLFTPESLRQLLEQAGLQVISIQYQPGHSFWMYSLHHRLRYGSPERPAVARWFDPFGGSSSLPLLAFFTGVDKLRAALNQRTSAMLVLARKA